MNEDNKYNKISYKIVNDKDFDIDKLNNKVYDFYPDRKFKETIHVIPYYTETWGGKEYMQCFFLADRLNIQVVFYVEENLFPFASIYCHKCVLRSKGNYDMLSRHSDINRFPHELYQDRVFYFNESGYYRLLDLIGFLDAKKILKKKIHLGSLQSNIEREVEEKRLVTDNQLFDYFRDKVIYITKNSYDAYQKIKNEFKSGEVWCEIKKEWYEDVEKIILTNDVNGIIIKDTLSIEPYSKKIQKRLIEQYPDSFLSIQLLLSIKNGVRFIGIGGSAQLFEMIPINTLLLFTKDRHFRMMIELKKELQKYQYNSIPVIHVHTAIRYIDIKLYENWLSKHNPPDKAWWKSAYDWIEILEKEFNKLLK